MGNDSGNVKLGEEGEGEGGSGGGGAHQIPRAKIRCFSCNAFLMRPFLLPLLRPTLTVL